MKSEKKNVPGLGQMSVLDDLWLGSVPHPDLGAVDVTFDCARARLPSDAGRQVRAILTELQGYIAKAVEYAGGTAGHHWVTVQMFDGITFCVGHKEDVRLNFEAGDEAGSFFSAAFRDGAIVACEAEYYQ